AGPRPTWIRTVAHADILADGLAHLLQHLLIGLQLLGSLGFLVKRCDFLFQVAGGGRRFLYLVTSLGQLLGGLLAVALFHAALAFFQIVGQLLHVGLLQQLLFQLRELLLGQVAILLRVFELFL